jgi:hypothetical protein
MTVYGSPMVQAMVGLRSDDAEARRRIGRDVTREASAHKMAAELEAHVERGGLCRRWFAPSSISGSVVPSRRWTNAPPSRRSCSVW